tara:strand:- start:460 stop:891 length:432 start_codon:yes stop_codon:yes gene_type:complete
MRNYIAKLKISLDHKNLKVGTLGEIYFAKWFNANYQGESIFKQMADRDFQGIDFACQKGFTYQIKATDKKSFTFNSTIADAPNKLSATHYVFIQRHDDYLFIQGIYKKDQILTSLVPSKMNKKQSFCHAIDLLQYFVNIEEIV